MEKKTYEIVTKAKAKRKSTESQTDISLGYFEEKLREKDKKIQALEKELLKYKSEHMNISGYTDKNMEIAPSIENTGPYPEVSPYFRQRILFSSEDFDTDPKFLKQLNTKIPLDTANIEEIDNIITKDLPYTITPDPHSDTSSKFFIRNFRKKPLPPMVSKSSIVRHSKVSLKSKTKLHKNTSIISDLLFQEDTDKES